MCWHSNRALKQKRATINPPVLLAQISSAGLAKILSLMPNLKSVELYMDTYPAISALDNLARLKKLELNMPSCNTAGFPIRPWAAAPRHSLVSLWYLGNVVEFPDEIEFLQEDESAAICYCRLSKLSLSSTYTATIERAAPSSSGYILTSSGLDPTLRRRAKTRSAAGFGYLGECHLLSDLKTLVLAGPDPTHAWKVSQIESLLDSSPRLRVINLVRLERTNGESIKDWLGENCDEHVEPVIIKEDSNGEGNGGYDDSEEGEKNEGYEEYEEYEENKGE
ncbi:hypothetical protein BGX26_012720 [Mortierella sp. AD094]|nr:hypothetical protein BGX26_012720 [Mortierella sp. AD094]